MAINIESFQLETIKEQLETSESKNNSQSSFDNPLHCPLSANDYFRLFRIAASDETLESHNQVFQYLRSAGYLAKLDDSEIHTITYKLNSYSKVFEKFRKLSQYNQTKIIFNVRTNKNFRVFQLYCLIQAIELAGDPDFSFLDFGLYNFENFIAPFKGKISKEAASLPSKNFHVTTKNHIEVVASGHLTFNTLHILRALYGERRILEFFEHFDDSGTDWSRLNFVEIIERWENLKDYPPEWIASLVGVKE